MAKPVLLALRRPQLPEFTLRGLCDPDQPDVAPFDLTLRKLDPLQQANLDSVATGFFEEIAKSGGSMPLLSGDALEITKDVAVQVAAIHGMQADPDPYDLRNVAALMGCMDAAWSRVQVVASLLQGARITPDTLPLYEQAFEREGPALRALALRVGALVEKQDEPETRSGAEDGEGNAPGATEPAA